MCHNVAKSEFCNREVGEKKSTIFHPIQAISQVLILQGSGKISYIIEDDNFTCAFIIESV
jgi:hypothetical protein